MHLKSVKIDQTTFPVTDCYPFNLDTLQLTETLSFESPVTFFIGENGTGKSTLIESIARKCGIYIWGESDIIQHKPNPYASQFHISLQLQWHKGRVPGSFFGSQAFRNYTKIIETWALSDPGILEYYGGKSLLTQSHGQSIMSFFKACFKVPGVYILDEPEAGLSPTSQLQLLQLIKENSHHSQFIIATHSPILISYDEALVYSFDSAPISTIEYTKSNCYLIYKDIFTKHKKEE